MLLSAMVIAAPLYAAESDVDVTIAPQTISVDHETDSDGVSASIKNAELCAMDLTSDARHIYHAVSPKVEGDSNLRKLVKKHVRPKVFSGKLSIKSARKHAQAASVCLKLLKQAN